MSKDWPGPQRGWTDGRWGGREEGRRRRAGPGQEGLWDFVSGGRDQTRPRSQGPGEPYTSRGSRSSGVPVMAKERCLMSPPGGRTDLGRDTQMSRSVRFCRAMLIKLNSGGLVSPGEKAMAPHSSTLAWKIPWTEEPGRLQSMGSHRVGHD